MIFYIKHCCSDQVTYLQIVDEPDSDSVPAVISHILDMLKSQMNIKVLIEGHCASSATLITVLKQNGYRVFIEG